MHGSLSKKKIKDKVFNMEILIRQELNADFDSVYEVVKVALLSIQTTMIIIQFKDLERLKILFECYPCSSS